MKRYPGCFYMKRKKRMDYETKAIEIQEADMSRGRYKTRFLRHGLTGGLLVLILSVGLLFVAGCSDNPVSSGSSQPQMSTTLDPQVGGPYDVSAGDLCRYGSGWAYPRWGGRISLNFGSRINRLIVPPGAVNERTFIEVSSCLREGTAKGEKFLEFEFAPNDLVFKRAAYLVLDLKNLRRVIDIKKYEGRELKLYYYNPETQAWELYQVAKIRFGRVIFKIEHFSKFGISH
jgi:hypothetical protein